jgi:hypothetical protein
MKRFAADLRFVYYATLMRAHGSREFAHLAESNVGTVLGMWLCAVLLALGDLWLLFGPTPREPRPRYVLP